MTLAAYRAIFQNRAYRLFWIGFTCSVLGDALTRVAFTWFVYELTGSAAALGLLQLCYTGPVIIGGLLAGWLLDRYGRRRVMILDNLLRGGAIALIPLLYWLGWLEIWHIYAAAAIYGLLWMISLAGGPALIPALVPTEQLTTANALEMLGFTIGGVIGPVLAGWLITRISAPNVVVVDVFSYLLFAFLLGQIRSQADWPTVVEAVEPTQPQTYGLADAVALLRYQPILLATTLMFMALNIGGGMMAVWLPIFADKVLGGGSALYGTLVGVQSLAEVISSLLAGSMSLPGTLGLRIIVAQTLSGVTLLALVLTPTAGFAGAALFLWGGFSAPLTIWAQTLRMKIIPAPLRGRTFALLRTIMQGGNPIGGALGGLLLPLLGVPAMVLLSALLVSVPGLIGYGVKALREDKVKR